MKSIFSIKELSPSPILKKVACYIIIASFFSSQINGLVIYVNFKINQDFIARVLCINKDKPMSNCKGRCQLAKQLKDQKEKEDSRLPQSKKEKNDILFYLDNFLESKNSINQLLREVLFPPNHPNFSLANFVGGVFRPPRIA